MAQVVSVSARGSPLMRGIDFEVDLDHPGANQLLLHVGGWLSTTDGFHLAQLVEDLSGNPGPRILAARGTEYDRSLFTGGKYRVKLTALLTPEALDQIENARMTNTKNDVHLKLLLQAESLTSSLAVANFWYLDRDDVTGRRIQMPPRNQQGNTPLTVEKPGGGTIQLQVVAKGYDPHFVSQDPYVLTTERGGGQPQFLYVTFDKPELLWRIPAADWVHDYAPKLGLRERFLVEFPSPTGKLPDVAKYLKAAEDAMAKWDSKSIFANCRELGKYLDSELEKVLGAQTFVYKERWGRAYAQFNHRASLDLHFVQIGGQYPNDPTAQVDRRDCDGLFFSARALAKYAEELVG